MSEPNILIKDRCIQRYCVDTDCEDCKINSICSSLEGSFYTSTDACEKAYELIDDKYKVDIPSTNDEYDTVNRPKHYNREGAMQCIDEMLLLFGKEAVKNFCLCNAWKYRYRAADKNGMEDIAKSDFYIQKYKELCG